MKNLALALICVGVVWVFVAFNMDTSVITGGETYGSGEYAIHVPTMRVNNLGLMNEKQNNLIISSLILLIGIALYLFSYKNNNIQSKAKSNEVSENKQIRNRIQDFLSVYIENETIFKADSYLLGMYTRASEQDNSLKVKELDDALSYAMSTLTGSKYETGHHDDIIETITKLSNLNKSGAISDGEFAKKKEELLAKL